MNTVLNVLIDLTFLADIFVVFRTAFIDSEGEVVDDAKIVAKRYLKGSFTIDILSTFPLDSIIGIFVSKEVASKFKIFGALKLIRLTRLNRIIRKMAARKEIKSLLKLGKLVFFLMMWVHVQGCLMFYFLKMTGTWIPPFDLVWDDPSKNTLWAGDATYQYLTAFYYSNLFLVGNDNAPTGTLNIMYGAVCIAAGIAIIANMFGELAMLLDDLTEFEQER